MRHEPSDSLPPLQATAERCCPVCRAVRPLDAFPVPGAPAGCCGLCRRQQRILRQVARRAEASYRALLTQHAIRRGGRDAA
jgi:hypothetical protein